MAGPFRVALRSVVVAAPVGLQVAQQWSGFRSAHAPPRVVHCAPKVTDVSKLNPEETDQRRLRSMCAELPRPVVPNWPIGGDNSRKKYLSSDNIRFLVRRQLEEEAVQQNKAYREARATDPACVAHMFWTTATKGASAAIAPEGKLTHIAALGLHTALNVGFTVYLWSYHDTFDMEPLLKSHSQLHFEDAREHLSMVKFMDMLRAKWPWGNIADVVRFRAAHKLSDHQGAWVLDLDTFWLRKPTAANSPSATGHIVATCASRPRRGKDRAHWKYMYLAKPEERTCALPPMYFPPSSIVLEELQRHLWDAGAPPAMYTHWLNIVEQRMIAHGFSSDFQPPIRYHPCHNWVTLQTLRNPQKEANAMRKPSYGFEYNPAELVISKSVALNNPWQTTMPGKVVAEKDRTGPMKFLAGSFFCKLFRKLPLAPEVLQLHLEAQAYYHAFGTQAPPRLIATCQDSGDGNAFKKAKTTQGYTWQGHDNLAVAEIIDTLVEQRGSAAMDRVWQNLPSRGRQLLLAEIQRRGLDHGGLISCAAGACQPATPVR